MSLKYALLTVIREQPATGYELANQFDLSLKFIWRASHQQIYRELKLLSNDELIDAEVVSQSDRPDKKVYSITEQGEQALKAWINQNSKEKVTKDPLMIKFFAGDLFDEAHLMDEVRGLEQELTENLKLLNSVDDKVPDKNSRRSKMLRLALLRGKLIEQARLDWLQQVKQELQLDD